MPGKGLSYNLIVEAAAELVESSGFRSLSLHKVAARLGVKTSSLYKHIRNLDDLILGLNRYALTLLDTCLRRSIEEKTKADALRSLSEAYRTFATTYPELYQVILHLPSQTEESIRQLGYQTFRVFYQVLEPYYLGEEETYHRGRAFRSSLHGFLSLYQAGFFRSNPDADDSYRKMVEDFISSVEECSTMKTKKQALEVESHGA